MNIKNMIKGGLMLTLGLMATSCDGHMDMPDNGMKIGDVVCTDGKVMSLDMANSLGKEPIAVVFHINGNSDIQGKGYAVYLKDTPELEFTDSIGIRQNTSADIFAHDGNVNTHAMYSNRICSSPIAEYVFDMWKFGQSAYIPSVAQMRLLYAAKTVINPVIAKCGGTIISDDAKESWRWTSTEVEQQETAKAWLYSLGSGTMQETPKIQAHKTRPIITIND